MNIVAQISDLLQQIPLGVRKWVYRVGALLASVYGIWQATDGNWKAVVASLIAAAAQAMASANAKPEVDGSKPDLEEIDPETFQEDAPAPPTVE